MPVQRDSANGFAFPMWVAALLVAGFFVATATGLTACNSGERSLTDVDPNAVLQLPTYNHARAILEKSCVPCHRTGDDESEDDDAPGVYRLAHTEDPDLDTCEGIQEAFGDVLRVIFDDTMPPGAWPRLTEVEKATLFNWFIESGGCSPCTDPCE